MAGRKPENRWICTEEKSILTSPVMEILQRDCKSSEDDRTHRFFLLKSRDWCNIIPITHDGKVVMVKQFRIGISDHTVETPGGVADATDASIEETAIREMIEETGYVPMEGARCVSLGSCLPNPAIMDNRSHYFVVGPVRREREQKLDLGEMIEVVEIPLEELPERILAGEVDHALTLNAFFFFLLRSGAGSAALRAALLGFVDQR